MNKAERAALTALLDNVGLGFTKCLAETKLLREFLTKRKALDALTDSFLEAAAKAPPAKLKRPAPKKQKASKQPSKRKR